jgi:hypothetical protein
MSTEICPECHSTIRPGYRGACVSCVSCLRREIAGLRAANTDLRAKGARFAGADCCEKAELLDEIERLRACEKAAEVLHDEVERLRADLEVLLRALRLREAAEATKGKR